MKWFYSLCMDKKKNQLTLFLFVTLWQAGATVDTAQTTEVTQFYIKGAIFYSEIF